MPGPEQSDGNGLSPGAMPAAPGAGDCPLEALRAMHVLQRQTCIDMETLADTTIARPSLALRILVTFCRDLPLHHADEDDDLFPLLRRRATADDDIERLLNRLGADHAASAGQSAPLIAALGCMADGALPAPEDRTALRALAQSGRRHMTIENAIILPLAKARLTCNDLAALRAAMVARRLAPPTLQGPCRRLLRDRPGTDPSTASDPAAR